MMASLPTKRRRQRLSRLSLDFILSLLILCILFLGCHCIDDTLQEAAADTVDSDNNDTAKIITNEVTLDSTSAEMARRLIKRMKEVKDKVEKSEDDDDESDDNSRKSWDVLIQLMDHLATSSAPEQPNKTNDSAKDSIQSIHHHLTQNEARKRALYWLSHQDTYEQKEVGTGFLHRYALAVIYFSLEGDSWNRCSSASHSGTGSIKANDCPTDKERYLSSASHRFWDGVNGNRDDTVTWLDLSNRNVYSENFLPLELTLLSPTLELLWLSENPDLSGKLPEYIGEFQKLVSLNVHKTSVGGALPDSLYTLKKLSSLRLYKSKFTGSISANIDDMGRLKWLWIHDNDFKGTVPEEIGNLKKLEGVTLHGNNFVPIVKKKVEEEDEKLLAHPEEGKVHEEKEEEDEAPKEDNRLRRMLTSVVEKEEELDKLDGLNHHKKKHDASDANGESDAREIPTKTDTQAKPDEKGDTEVTQEGIDKQKDSTEAEDWKSLLKGNIIPESLCSLMKQKKLKHLWTDCEDDAFHHGGSGLSIKEGVHACSCCTKCFPKKDQKTNVDVE